MATSLIPSSKGKSIALSAPTSPPLNKSSGIDTIIAGHTHRPVYQNLTLTEKRLLDSKICTPDIEDKTPDPSYYNTGSCVHPRCITGIEITLGQNQKPEFTLIKWAQSAQPTTTRKSDLSSGEYNLSIKRTVLEYP